MSEPGTIIGAEVQNLMENEVLVINAKTYVLAAGAVLTPQILFNSGIRPPVLGQYLCEQPMTFCQIVLLQSIVDDIEKRVKRMKLALNPDDPIPIPIDDPPPQVCNLHACVICQCLYRCDVRICTYS